MGIKIFNKGHNLIKNKFDTPIDASLVNVTYVDNETGKKYSKNSCYCIKRLGELYTNYELVGYWSGIDETKYTVVYWEKI